MSADGTRERAEVCSHGRVGACEMCRLVQRGFDVEGVRKALEHRKGAMAERARKSLERLRSEALHGDIQEALDWIWEDPGREAGMLLGGDFADEQGRTRDRKVVSLAIPDLLEDKPHLWGLCAKIVGNKPEVHRELLIHSRIQEAIDKASSSRLRIPRLIGIKPLGTDSHLAVIMEALPSGPDDQSLQRFVEGTKRRLIVPKISEEVTAAINSAFAQLHKLGFRHGDINDGNVYLTNMVIKTYEQERPSLWRGVWPSRIRMVTAADVVLLDFERTSAFPASNPDKVLLRAEMDEVRRMTDEVEFPDLEDLTEEELIATMRDRYKAA